MVDFTQKNYIDIDIILVGECFMDDNAIILVMAFVAASVAAILVKTKVVKTTTVVNKPAVMVAMSIIILNGLCRCFLDA